MDRELVATCQTPRSDLPCLRGLSVPQKYTPQDIGPAHWGAFSASLETTRVELSAGRQNTGIILDAVRRFWENGTAAQLCQVFTYGG
ncbi:MAG: hypothetical protein LBO67_10350 [Spirochaetaceae bacterium]|nr:hypothetical protein [Spirochaetaceae bacterium]